MYWFVWRNSEEASAARVQLAKRTVVVMRPFKEFNSNAFSIPKDIFISSIREKIIIKYLMEKNRRDFAIDSIKFAFLSSRARMFKEEGGKSKRKVEERKEKEQACPAQPGFPRPSPIPRQNLCIRPLLPTATGPIKDIHLEAHRELTCPG